MAAERERTAPPGAGSPAGGPAAPVPHAAVTAVLLAATAGFVDTVGFVALFGLFAAHVTGNFVLIGAALVQDGDGLLAKLLALPVFVAAVALAAAFAASPRRSPHARRLGLIALQAVLLGAFFAASFALGPVVAPDAPATLLASLSAVAAMGVQNAAARLAFPALSPTTVMTGNVTQLTIELVSRREAAPVPTPAGRLFWPLAAFAAGCVAGALGYRAFGFACLLAPFVALLLAGALHARRPGPAA